MNKVIKDGKEVVGVGRVYLTYHGDGNVGIGTPPQVASAPMGEPFEHLRVSMTDGAGSTPGQGVLAIWGKAIAQEREACAKVVEEYCGAWNDEGYALAAAIRARGEK